MPILSLFDRSPRRPAKHEGVGSYSNTPSDPKFPAITPGRENSSSRKDLGDLEKQLELLDSELQHTARQYLKQAFAEAYVGLRPNIEYLLDNLCDRITKALDSFREIFVIETIIDGDSQTVWENGSEQDQIPKLLKSVSTVINEIVALRQQIASTYKAQNDNALKNLLPKLPNGNQPEILQNLDKAKTELQYIEYQLNYLQFQEEEPDLTVQSVRDKLNKLYNQLILETISWLFQKAQEEYAIMEATLKSPDFAKIQNGHFLAEVVQPKLVELQQQNIITKDETEEIIRLLRLRLNFSSDSEDYPGAAAAEFEKESRLNQLLHNRDEIVRLVGGTDARCNQYYGQILDLLFYEMIKQKIGQLGDSLSDHLNQKNTSEAVAHTAAQIINSAFGLQTVENGEGGEQQFLKEEDFKNFEGWSRWPIIRDFARSAEIVPEAVLDQIEKKIVETLIVDLTTHRDSIEGRRIAEKIGYLSSFWAVPKLLDFIQKFEPSSCANCRIINIIRELVKNYNSVPSEILATLTEEDRTVLSILANPESVLNRIFDSSQIGLVYPLLQKGYEFVAKERLAEALVKYFEPLNSPLLEGSRKFYLSGWNGQVPLEKVLLNKMPYVQRLIAESKQKFWTQRIVDGLLTKMVVDPKDFKDFAQQIFDVGLEITDQKTLDNLNKILEDNLFLLDSDARKEFLRGLLFLNSEANGQAVLQILIAKHNRMSAQDEKIGISYEKRAIHHLLRILQLLLALNDLEEKKWMAILQRKKLGLDKLESALKFEVQKRFCEKLKLSSEYSKKVEDQLTDLIENGLLRSILDLANYCESTGEQNLQRLLQEATRHILDGTFQSWRSDRKSRVKQIPFLNIKSKPLWPEEIKTVVVTTPLTEKELQQMQKGIEILSRIFKRVEPIIYRIGLADFVSPEAAIARQEMQIKQLDEYIQSESSPERKATLSIGRRILQAELDLMVCIREFGDLPNQTDQDFPWEKLLEILKRVESAMQRAYMHNNLKTYPDLANMYHNLSIIQTIDRILADHKSQQVIAYATQDPEEILGTYFGLTKERDVSKLSLMDDLFNGEVNSINGNRDVVIVEDGDGNPVARAVIVPAILENPVGRVRSSHWVLFLDLTHYSSNVQNDRCIEAILNAALQKFGNSGPVQMIVRGLDKINPLLDPNEIANFVTSHHSLRSQLVRQINIWESSCSGPNNFHQQELECVIFISQEPQDSDEREQNGPEQMSAPIVYVPYPSLKFNN